ncbi:PREDICTED: F-box protein At1g30790-like [Ipomoea nil]|uniref:F-box protein At1g30790-like n=1 Tax=Ipomoea nil TaxID=35883 RepID=UPI0009013428|nr:PREDICTED: F-box protein At1g30790-like [Ipomoea nil]
MENCKFPRELLIEILARLPVKSLLRFKSVSKSFYSLIKSDNHFQHKHYEISRVRRDYAIFERRIGISEFRRERVFGLVYKELDSDEIGCVDLPLPSSETVDVKCIEGILCLIAVSDDGTRNISMWNPSTREIKALPPISPPHNSIPHKFLTDDRKESIGFGFCNNMRGKVVIVWCCGDEDEWKCEYKVMVCSEVDNIWGWREINPHPLFDRLWPRPYHDIYLKGKYYWNFYGYSDRGSFTPYLLCFDISAETFGTISLPSDPPCQNGDEGKGLVHANVSVMNDTIALIGYRGGRRRRDGRWEVWLMMQNGSEVNWHKYASIGGGDDILRPIRIWNQDRHLLMQRMNAEIYLLTFNSLKFMESH